MRDQSARTVPPHSMIPRVIGFLWFVGFCVWFYTFTLPNNQFPDGSPIPRLYLWEILPELLLENVFPTRTAQSPPSGWQFVPQRLDLIAVATIILAGAWGLGNLILRLLKIRSALDRLEQTVFAFGLGLSGVSLLTMGFGVAGWLNRWLAGGGLAAFFTAEAWLQWQKRVRTNHPVREHTAPWTIRFEACAVLVAVAPFVMAMLLGAMLPSTDFDVKEYHLQGPKEYFHQGRITFLPHNVYTSFPFLTEMLSLLGMVLRNDWFRGALAGKVVLMSFAPLTALGLFASGRRWFGPTVAWMAVLVHLTIPWVYRISIIAYTEGGLSFYLFAALLAVLHGVTNGKLSLRFTLLAGLLAGSAVACKYPGVISVAFPLGAAVVGAAFIRGGTARATQSDSRRISAGGAADAVRAFRFRFAARTAATFLLGTLITFGPWMLKNVAETGNPVYPLLYTVFGGSDWNDAMNTKWRNAHAVPVALLRDPARIPGDLAAHLVDVIAKSDWQSPLVFALAPLAIAGRHRRGMVLALWMYVFWLFVTWWALTHRIDRFWLPLLPVTSLLSGIGMAWLTGAAPEDEKADRQRHADPRTAVDLWQAIIRIVTCVIVAAAISLNLGFVTSALCGYNAYLIDLAAARKQASTPSIRLLNELGLPDTARVLFVGEAQVFDAEFEHVYNTVFDDSIFQRWTAAAEPGIDERDQPLRSSDEIRATFVKHGITHVFVNWNEIARYRAPGSYGFTEFVTPERFRELVTAGVLTELSLDPRTGYQLFTVN